MASSVLLILRSCYWIITPISLVFLFISLVKNTVLHHFCSFSIWLLTALQWITFKYHHYYIDNKIIYFIYFCAAWLLFPEYLPDLILPNNSPLLCLLIHLFSKNSFFPLAGRYTFQYGTQVTIPINLFFSSQLTVRFKLSRACRLMT